MFKSIGIAFCGGAIGVPILGVVAVGVGVIGIAAGVGYILGGSGAAVATAALVC